MTTLFSWISGFKPYKILYISKCVMYSKERGPFQSWVIRRSRERPRKGFCYCTQYFMF